MPVSYKLDRGANLIRTRCYGLVTLEEVCRHFIDLRGEPGLPKPLDVFLDWAAITSAPTAEEIEGATQCMSVLKKAVEFRYCAVVARRDALYGLARMWAVLVEPYFAEIRVFRSAAEAEQWLESAREKPKSNTA